jgi:hypothetical protein
VDSPHVAQHSFRPCNVYQTSQDQRINHGVARKKIEREEYRDICSAFQKSKLLFEASEQNVKQAWLDFKFFGSHKAGPAEKCCYLAVASIVLVKFKHDPLQVLAFQGFLTAFEKSYFGSVNINL